MAKLAKHAVIIGAGWSGCAAGVELASKDWQVTLLESARVVGGRARRVEIHGKSIDNGQHILLGAYSASLGIMRKVGIALDDSLLRLPLQMCYPEHADGMHFLAPKLPAPLHLLLALWHATGLSKEDKLALARFSTTARWMDWQLLQDCSVTELLQRYDQTERLCRLMWIPLCIAALNTPPERASAQVFLNVLRGSLGANRAASDMLIPRVDLSALFPKRAVQYLEQRGGKIIVGATAKQIAPHSQNEWVIQTSAQDEHQAIIADAVIIATPAEQARELLTTIDLELAAHIPALDYEPITTCYLQYDQTLRLPRPFFALIDQAEIAHWGQFVFDRGQLDANQAGLLAVVVSASTAAIQLNHDQLAQNIAAQLAQALQMPALAKPLWRQIISEKRATYSCTPGLQRPANKTSRAKLMIAGDYTASDYPATLESAVRSGIAAAKQLMMET